MLAQAMRNPYMKVLFVQCVVMFLCVYVYVYIYIWIRNMGECIYVVSSLGPFECIGMYCRHKNPEVSLNPNPPNQII